MNAFNTINLAGACLLTSTEYAKELGIPESKWVYPLGAAGTRDSYECELLGSFPGGWLADVRLFKVWNRPDYHSSPSISRSIDAALAVSGVTKDDIDLHDFYSSVNALQHPKGKPLSYR